MRGDGLPARAVTEREEENPCSSARRPLLHKLGRRDRLELTRYAAGAGLIDP
ncbi:hypothetical protein [Streptomyces sp. NPDC058307]|uniref:hypothetical protein n=1 Tax=Streptomyces sp. NPDC058307 TaxID=3346439 RepID=UPI0036ED8B14